MSYNIHMKFMIIHKNIGPAIIVSYPIKYNIEIKPLHDLQLFTTNFKISFALRNTITYIHSFIKALTGKIKPQQPKVYY